jgi:hypothetical protein
MPAREPTEVPSPAPSEPATSSTEALRPAPSPEEITLSEQNRLIEAEIEAINKEAEKREKPSPNARDVSRQAARQLQERGYKVIRDEVYKIAMQDKFKEKRRAPGEHH